MNKTRRHLLGAGLTVPMLGGCIFSHDVFIEWEEEILLPDGKTMMVHVKYRWERLSRGFTPRGGRFILRDSWLTFDAGLPVGKVTQYFQGFGPRFIGLHDGVWYVWLDGGSYYQSHLKPDQKWQFSKEIRGAFAKLVDDKFQAIQRSEFPSAFTKTNFLWVRVEPRDFFQLNGAKLTLSKKNNWPDRENSFPYLIHNHV
jgi:hypothetical protein